MTEMLVLVDEHDQQVGVGEKMQVHQAGLLHRAFSVFVIRKMDNEFEILLQQRKFDKYHCGALWTNTCCSHPRINEDVVDGAERRLQEEMGIGIKLQLLDSFTYRAEFSNGLIEHEYDHVLVGHYSGEDININPDEVQSFTWISIPTLLASLQVQPQLYTPWLLPALGVLQAHLEKIT
ncbi:MAG TPA: isopentenyl-diphosphate Delta-isomerase [Gammaproteobacteria bacterium]|nr:isopentenyl-diphosphate Delta-isomerase [Gammaproteobacteria bacterium]